jgi:hypothetical protein
MMTYALMTDYQKETKDEPRSYAGRILSLHSSRDTATSAYGREKTRRSFAIGGADSGMAIAAIVGSLPVRGEEVTHAKIRAIFSE